MSSLPTPSELSSELPLSLDEKEFVLKSRCQVASILDGSDPRKLLIVGPCSVHRIEDLIDYALKLKSFIETISDTFFVVMRAYFEKPRTQIGWKGFLHDPFLDGSYRIDQGLVLTRNLLKSLTGLQIPIATEFLDPLAPSYLSDYITWGCIGARTTTSQIHRQIASSLPLPIGFKNTTDGSIENAIHGVESARIPHAYMGMNIDGRMALIRSQGNPLAHVVLRGGQSASNYDQETVQKTARLLRQKNLPASLLIDCSHDNSRKIYPRQATVFEEVMNQILEGETAIKGLMLESFLHAGHQPLSPNLQYGVSITDPCLDFDTTAQLLLKGAKLLQPAERCAAL